MTTVDGHPAGTPCWLDLMTDDAAGSREFYTKVFGWSYEVGPPESGPYSMAFVDGRPAAGIGTKPPDAPFPNAWTVYFASDDVDASAKRIGELGGSVDMPPMDVFEEGRMLVAADPTGAVFGLWQPKRHKGARVIEEHGSLAWCEVNTRDGAKARDFYAKALELSPEKLETPDMDYWVLKRGDRPYGGVMQMNEKWPPEIPAHWMAYFAVDDADAAVATARKAGGEVKVEPFDTPYGRMAVIADPFCAVFSVIVPAQPS